MRTDRIDQMGCTATPAAAAERSPAQGVGAPIRVPSILLCGLLITWIKVLLRTRGFKGTLDWIRWRLQGVPIAAAGPVYMVRPVERAVAVAAALYPARARCLEQSLALYYILRRQGFAARYCQGVQPYPFQAHAWIEYGNEVINDVPEHAEQFARLPDQLP
jgi:Transglutaminase-like superfamily